MALLAVCIRISSPGRALFTQERVGQHGRPFRIYKFRTMREPDGRRGRDLTSARDARVTRLGRWMRRWKLDELPQFWNVLRGEMSLVGPRPTVARYTGLAAMPYRPGITGAATLAFRHEEDLIGDLEGEELERFYARSIRPVKARLDACSMCQATPVSELRVLMATLLSCLGLEALLRGRLAEGVVEIGVCPERGMTPRHGVSAAAEERAATPAAMAG
jgi:lipopolysaccharide/colanic/teichoic acid biosynthesis glycosyltransferase